MAQPDDGDGHRNSMPKVAEHAMQDRLLAQAQGQAQARAAAEHDEQARRRAWEREYAAQRRRSRGYPIAMRVFAGILALAFLGVAIFGAPSGPRTLAFGIACLLYAVRSDKLLRKMFPFWMKPVTRDPPPLPGTPPPPELPPAEIVRTKAPAKTRE